MKVSYELDLNRIEELIYINPHSPLFAHLSDLLAKRGQIDEAIKICESGLRNYRFYVSGYIMLAMLYRIKGEYKNSFIALKNALTLSPNCPSAIECLIRWKSELEDNSISTDELGIKKVSSYPEKFLNSAPHVIEKIAFDNNITAKDELEKILEKLEKSESLIIKADPSFDLVYEPPKHKETIATETLYAIYISQGLYNEAIHVLERLRDKNPAKKDEYTARIKALTEKIEVSKSII
jgi:tetratricopeptide (TPR) repeat protein